MKVWQLAQAAYLAEKAAREQAQAAQADVPAAAARGWSDPAKPSARYTSAACALLGALWT
jgi:hypothetical protein